MPNAARGESGHSTDSEHGPESTGKHKGQGLGRGALLPKCLDSACSLARPPQPPTRACYRPPVAVPANAAEQRPTVGEAADGKEAVSVAGAGPPPLAEAPHPPEGTEGMGWALEQRQALPGLEVPEAQHAGGPGLGRGQQQAAPIQSQGRNLEEAAR